MMVRNYRDSDYEQLKALYERPELFGGQFDPDRDSRERLAVQSVADPESILVADVDGHIVGTVSLITDKRVAWLFRFASENQAEQALYDKAVSILKFRGHKQVLVYSPVGDKTLDLRYSTLGLTKGNDFTCFWKEV
jgi:hypothetical protein